MPMHVKLPTCFGSSKWVRMELLCEPSLLRGPLWKNTYFIERNASGVMVPAQTGKPLCQELTVNLAGPGGKMEYTPTEWGCPTPLTLAASPPSWDDYLDLGETVTEMAHHLMEEDGQQAKMLPKTGTTPKWKDIAQVKALTPSDDITMLPDSAFPSFGLAGSLRDNPVHLSDTTDASASGSHPTKDTEMEDKAMVLSHFSNALSKMAASIMDLENGYFKALHEVIIKTEKALCDMSRIDAHYISHMVMVMTSWQETVQAAASHMEGVDTTTYLTCREDAWRATHEYVKEVIQAPWGAWRCPQRGAEEVHRGHQNWWLQGSCCLPIACHPQGGLHPSREGCGRVPFQHKVYSPQAHTCPCTRALDHERPEHSVPIPDECVAYDRRGVCTPRVGEALGLVWLGRHRPGHSGDISQELCSDVSFPSSANAP